jgi:hypothetical protein
MKRCAQCGRKFGLIRHRWHGYQFCTKKCRDDFLDRLGRGNERLHKWLGYLNSGPRR